MFYHLPQRCFFMWVAHSVLRGGNSISVHTHTRLHRLGTNCCFRRVPRNFIKSIGDYKLVLSCVCWLILPPLTVISLHTSTIETQQLLHHHPTGWIIPVEGAERELPKTWPHGFAILGYLRYPPRTRVSQSWLLNTWGPQDDIWWHGPPVSTEMWRGSLSNLPIRVPRIGSKISQHWKTEQ